MEYYDILWNELSVAVMEHKMVTWDETDSVVEFFIDTYNTQNLDCELILGIPRGGLVLATMLSYRLDLPLMVEGFGPTTHWDSKILVVDDIADTGKTLKRVLKNLSHGIVFTMHYHQQSVVEPHAWLYEKKDEWIVYPWEGSYATSI